MASPGAPAGITFSNIKNTSVTVTIVEGPTNGFDIDAHSLIFSTGSDREDYDNISQVILTGSDKTYNASGLKEGAIYNVWAQTRSVDASPVWGPFAGPYQVNLYNNWTTPQPPAAPDLRVISGTEVELDWGGYGEDYGHPVDDREYWGSPTTSPEHQRDYAANYRWTGLTRGTTYYFWAKQHTRVGWSGFSPRSSIKTWDLPPAPSAPVISNVEQTSVRVAFSSNGDGGKAVDDWQVGYGTNSSAPTTWVDYPSAPTTIANLQPGTRYYFWSRGHNSVGYSANSARSQADTLAGAYVLVGNVWKRAVPYVRVSGVWKVARPWTKIAGVWKEDIS